jgi:hypothetical protein
MGQEKVDLFKVHSSEYVKPKDPVLVETQPANYLAIDGMGEPGGDQFSRRVGALYAVAYTLKMTKKKAGQDYVVAKLQAQYWGVGGPGDFSSEPMSEWNWKLMIRTPDFVTEADVADAKASCLAKKSDVPEIGKVNLVQINEGTCVQLLHIGPYSDEERSIKRMNEFAKEKGLSFHGLHHEIYLSDPRRVPPERLKTILRMPVVDVG